jgi:hypothetical protein
MATPTVVDMLYEGEVGGPVVVVAAVVVDGTRQAQNTLHHRHPILSSIRWGSFCKRFVSRTSALTLRE